MSAQRAPPTSCSPLVSDGAGGHRRYGIVAHRRNTTVEPMTNVALMMTVMASREAYAVLRQWSPLLARPTVPVQIADVVVHGSEQTHSGVPRSASIKPGMWRTIRRTLNAMAS